MTSYSKNPYHILGLDNTGHSISRDDIKRAYKEIALSCHPDKLIHIIDDNEKQRRINKFKEASVAYEILIKHLDEGKTYSFNNTDTWDDDVLDWKDIWNKFFDKEAIKETLYDIANQFVKSKIYPKSYYSPTSNLNTNKKVHEVKLEVSYTEILNNTKKKLRLILLDIDEPLFIDIYCGAFPQIIKEYTQDSDSDSDGYNGNDVSHDIVHEIIINMEIKKKEHFDHIISKSGSIDIITSLDISLQEYLTGYTKQIEYIDGKILDVYVPPFQKEFYEIPSKGIKNGSFIINICIKNIEKDNWNILNEKDKSDMIRILDLLT